MSDAKLIESTFREQIANTLIDDIDAFCEKTYSDGHRKHLGASVMGEPCSRRLWYLFRHAKQPKYTSDQSRMTAGQVLRLFQRGHREEPALVSYLEGIGCKFEYDKENQFRVSDVAGHFGGSLDNIGYLPERYGITEKVLFEFKTANANYFNKLYKGGLKAEKPEHFVQMSIYGYKTDIQYGVYISVNKNTDELYIEIMHLDFELAKYSIERAFQIITAPSPVPKYSQSPANFICKFCPFVDICHYEAKPEKNCRTCQHSIPTEGGKWECKLYGEIPPDIQKTGCDPSYLPIVM